MRKLLASGLVMLHLLSYTELSQVIKLPDLISHFFQHHRQNPDIDFFDFLAMHYGGGDDGTSADNDIDNELPGHNTTPHYLMVMYSPMVRNSFSIGPVEHISPVYNNYVLEGVPSGYIALILHPPQQA